MPRRQRVAGRVTLRERERERVQGRETRVFHSENHTRPESWLDECPPARPMCCVRSRRRYQRLSRKRRSTSLPQSDGNEPAPVVEGEVIYLLWLRCDVTKTAPPYPERTANAEYAPCDIKLCFSHTNVTCNVVSV